MSEWQEALKRIYRDRIQFDDPKKVVGLDGRFSEPEINHINRVADENGYEVKDLSAA